MKHQSQDTIDARSNARAQQFDASLEGFEAVLDQRQIARHIAAGRRLRAETFANFLKSAFSWSARKATSNADSAGGQALQT